MSVVPTIFRKFRIDFSMKPIGESPVHENDHTQIVTEKTRIVIEKKKKQRGGMQTHILCELIKLFSNSTIIHSKHTQLHT